MYALAVPRDASAFKYATSTAGDEYDDADIACVLCEFMCARTRTNGMNELHCPIVYIHAGALCWALAAAAVRCAAVCVVCVLTYIRRHPCAGV